MKLQFENKHIIVTGGANGIGRSIAASFLKEGGAVTVIDIDKKRGEELAGEYAGEQGGGIRFFHGDIAEKTVLESFVQSLDRPADCLINNACISRRGLLPRGEEPPCSYEDFEYVQRVGVTAPYYLTSLLLKGNLLAPGASIVNIASTRALQSQPNTESYSAAKGGIYALSHAMAVSLAGRARVNSISPGWIDTAEWQEGKTLREHSGPDKGQHPAGRVGRPEDIAEMALYLCSERAGFITGENITVDGGTSRLMVYNGDHGWTYK